MIENSNIIKHSVKILCTYNFLLLLFNYNNFVKNCRSCVKIFDFLFFSTFLKTTKIFDSLLPKLLLNLSSTEILTFKNRSALLFVYFVHTKQKKRPYRPFIAPLLNLIYLLFNFKTSIEKNTI